MNPFNDKSSSATKTDKKPPFSIQNGGFFIPFPNLNKR